MIALVDADSIIWWAIYDSKVDILEGTVRVPKTEITACQAFDDIMNMIILASGADKYIAFISDGRSHRTEVYPAYKGGRPEEKPPLIKVVEDYAINSGRAYKHKDYEADDCIITARKEIQKTTGEDTIILSLDKDLLNVEGKTYDYKNRVFRNNSRYESEDFFWKSMITGDRADNVKGIPGKGPAYAQKVFADRLTDQEFHELVLSAYITEMGEREGIKAFFANYICLKLLDEIEGFILPQPKQV